MANTHLDDEHGKTLQDLEEADKYVAFPGGIPRKWLNPAFYIFVVVFIGYALWVITDAILEGEKVGTPPVETAKSIVTHLSAFAVLLTLLIIVFCKGLERIMYYLDVKRIADQMRQRIEQAETARRTRETARRTRETARRTGRTAFRRVEKERLLTKQTRLTLCQFPVFGSLSVSNLSA